MENYFINISNHPTSKWGNKQLEAAKALGKYIIDIPFPSVPSEMPVEDLKSLIPELSYYDEEGECTIVIKKSAVVHLMGESTLVHLMVDELQRMGFTVVASTTERKSVEKDGVKTSIFEFVQFRQYPKIVHYRALTFGNGSTALSLGRKTFFVPDYMSDEEALNLIHSKNLLDSNVKYLA